MHAFKISMCYLLSLLEILARDNRGEVKGQLPSLLQWQIPTYGIETTWELCRTTWEVSTSNEKNGLLRST